MAFRVFNKTVEPERAMKIYKRLDDFGYFPKWRNLETLKEGKDWVDICWPEMRENSIKTAWSDMPPEMLAYIRSLPEFDDEIFKVITGIIS